MKLLSNLEEIFLLAIIRLGDNAYGVTIREEVSKATGESWSLGAIYDPLYRLESKGLIRSYPSRSTPERGGRSKRMFEIRPEGAQALLAHKRVRDGLWRRVGTAVVESK
ncbi:MAG: PadR family transcriptional regulator [Acidobacteriota bacterium]